MGTVKHRSAMFDAGQFQELYDECRMRRGAMRHNQESAESAVIAFYNGDFQSCRQYLYGLGTAWAEFEAAVRQAIVDAEEAAFAADEARWVAEMAEDEACP